MSEQEPKQPRDRGMTRRDVVMGQRLGRRIGRWCRRRLGIAEATEDEAAATTADAASAQFVKPREQHSRSSRPSSGRRGTSRRAGGPRMIFFVRNRCATPTVDAIAGTEGDGDAIEDELTLASTSFGSSSRTAPRVLECFGNGRTVNGAVGV